MARNLRGRSPKSRNTLGTVVQRARRLCRRTQAEVAEAIGKSIPFVSAVENGREQSALPETLIKWADFLGIERLDLLKLGAPKRVREWTEALAAGDDERRAS